jgi:hypothetical protein
LKPTITLPGRKDANRSRVARKWAVSEGIDVKERDGHLSAPSLREPSGGANNTMWDIPT